MDGWPNEKSLRKFEKICLPFIVKLKPKSSLDQKKFRRSWHYRYLYKNLFNKKYKRTDEKLKKYISITFRKTMNQKSETDLEIHQEQFSIKKILG